MMRELFILGGINHPWITGALFVALVVSGFLYSRFTKERRMSISAAEMHQMDPVINILTGLMIVLIIAVLAVVGI